MQRFVLCSAFVLIALVAAWFTLRADDGSVPMIPRTPAMPVAKAPDESVPVQGGAPHRVDGSPTPSRDERIARVEVFVQWALGEQPPRPLPWREVDLVTNAPLPALRLRSSTGADGRVHFEVPGGHGGTAQVIAGQSTRTTVGLRGDETTHVVLTVLGTVPVQGSVVDQSGNPVPAADIVLVPWIQTDVETPGARRIGRSAADGSFAIVLAAGGRLGAQRAGYGPSSLESIPPGVDPTTPAPPYVVQLTLLNQRATLEVRVHDPTGRPIAGASLEMRPTDANGRAAPQLAAPQRAITDAGGRASITDLRPGPLRWAVRSKGHATGRGRVHAVAGEKTLLDIELTEPCEVHGYVETTAGTRVAGARVWSGAAEDFDSVFATSGSDGAFRLVGLCAGHHVLSARDGGVAPTAARRARTEIDVIAGQIGHWVAVVAPEDEETGLRGRVVDTNERPLAKWRVVARTGSRTASTTTDAQGAFGVSRPAAGPIDLFVYSPTTPVGAFAAAVRRGIASDGEPVEVVVDLAAPTTSMIARVESPERQPLAASFVCHHRERGETVRFRARDDGALRVHPVPPGTLDVYVDHPGRAPENRRALVAPPNAPLDLGLIVLGDAASLHGAVTGPGGTAPEQVEITLQVPGQRLFAEYVAGKYRFPAAPPGRHVLQVQGPGVGGATFTVDLAPGVDREQPIELHAGVPRRIVVQVPESAGTPVSLAVRTPDRPHTWYGAAPVQGSATPAAEFVVFMAPGTYDVIAWCTGAWQGRAQVAFVAGDDSPVTIQLHPD